LTAGHPAAGSSGKHSSIGQALIRLTRATADGANQITVDDDRQSAQDVH